MPIGPLALTEHFPPVSKRDWVRRVQDEGKSLASLTWHAPAGFAAAPFYAAEDMPQAAHPLWTHGGWDIRARVTDAASAQRTLDAGARALDLGASHSLALLQDIPLDKATLHWDGGDAALLRALLDAAKARGVKARSGTIGQDAVLAPEALTEVAALTRAARGTAWRTIRVDTRHWHARGATLVQELCYATGAAAVLMTRLAEQGLSSNEIAQRLFFDVSIGTSYLPAIAQLRAMRHLVQQVFAAYGVDGPPLFIHATTSQRSYSSIDGATDVVRACSQAMSAVVGGADAVTVALPDQVLACHLQLLLRHEAHLGIVADPGAGSYYIESLTDALGQAAWRLLQELEQQGGFLAACHDGRFARLVRQARQRTEDALSTGTVALVGVSAFAAPEPDPFDAGAAFSDLDAFRLAKPFEHIRRATQQIAAHLGRPPIVRQDALPPVLRDLAKQILTVGGYAMHYDAASSGDAEVWVRAGASATPSTRTPVAPCVVTVTTEPDGTLLNIYPGCRITTLLEQLHEHLCASLGITHAH